MNAGDKVPEEPNASGVDTSGSKESPRPEINWSELYQTVAGLTHRWYGMSDIDADDIAQEVCVILLRRYPHDKVLTIHNLRAWVCQVARNIALSKMRQKM